MSLDTGEQAKPPFPLSANPDLQLTGPRFGAALLDLLIVYILVSVLIPRVVFEDGSRAYGDADNCDKICTGWKILAALTFSIPYMAASELFFGKTIGKAFAGLKVVSIDGTKRRRRILLRNVLRLFWLIPVPFLGLVADASFLGATEGKRNLRDVVAGTTVVGVRTPKLPP